MFSKEYNLDFCQYFQKDLVILISQVPQAPLNEHYMDKHTPL